MYLTAEEDPRCHHAKEMKTKAARQNSSEKQLYMKECRRCLQFFFNVARMSNRLPSKLGIW